MTQLGRLEGINVALVTPLNGDETVDEGGLRRLLGRVIGAGVHGVVVLGSAGEFAVLADSAKKEAIAITVDEVAGRVRVIAGTGEPGTKRAVAMTQAAKSLGADMAMVVPPYYYLCSPNTTREHYRILAAESGLPIILYNIPVFTKITLDIDTVCALTEVENIIGIKDSGGNFSHFQNLVLRAKSDTFSVLTGSDGLLFASLAVGGDGSIGPGANVVPAWFVALWDAVRQDRWEDAWNVELRILSLHGGLRYGAFPAGIKGALAALGVCQRTVTSPNVSVSDEQLQEIVPKLESWGLL